MNASFLLFQDLNPLLFSSLYAATFIVSILLFLYEGYRRNYPMITWLAIGVFITFCMVIGTKVSNYGMEDWKSLFQNGYLPAMAEKNEMGGLIGLLAGIFIAKRWFRFQPSILDGFAIALPVAMIFQRTGCLLTGCCFGLPTNVPWGIQYAGEYAVCSYHTATGIAGSAGGVSAIIHPVPIYLMISYLITVMVLLSVRNRLKAQGSQGLLAIVLVLSIRFIIEFFRDPVTNHGLGESFAGLKILQWALLAGVVIAGTLFIRKEYFATGQTTGIIPRKYGWKRVWLSAALLLGILWAGNGWFTILETLVLHVFYTGFLLALVTATFFHVTNPQLRYATLGLTALSLLLTSQTGKLSPDNTGESPRKHKIEIAYSRGSIEKGLHEAGCGEPDKYVKSYSTLGFDWTYAKEKLNKKGKPKINVGGAGLYYNTFKKYYEETIGEYATEEREETVSGAAIFGWLGEDLPYWGFRLGIQTGNTLMFRENYSDDDMIDYENPEIFPILYLRFGKKNSAYFEAGLGDELPYGTLTTRYKLGFGIGQNIIRSQQEFNLTLGFCEYIDKGAFYLDADFGIGKHLSFSPMLRIGEDQTYGLGLGYRW